MSEKDAKKGKGGGKDGKGRRTPAAEAGKQPRQPKQAARSEDRRRSAREKPTGRPACAPAGVYREQVTKDLTQQFGYKSPMQVPRIEKIVLNMGVGEAVADKKIMDNAVADMQKIAGQKPLVTKARTSVAQLQDPRRLSGRLQGDAARRAHVRVSRPPGERRDAAHPRLPRHLRARLSTAAATTTWA